MTSLAALTATTRSLPCREDPEPWYSPDPTERAYAARQCHACPLLFACMKQALAAGEQHGVWGGVDFEARAIGCGTKRGFQIHKRRREPVCPACQAAHDEAVHANRLRILAEAHKAGGTIRGYWMHRRLGEEACVPCKRACARNSAEHRERRRQGRTRARAAVVALGTTEAGSGAPGGVQGLAIAS